MPSSTERLQEARDAAGPGEMPYISKSRLTTYIKCPRTLYWKYIVGIKEPGNYHTTKGTRLHLVFEHYYQNVLDHYTEDFVDQDLPTTPWQLAQFLPDWWQLYADFLPYIGNFLQFELTRAANSRTLNDWLPVAIEAEEWDYEQETPWMGFADVILPAASIPDLNKDDGVVILDFKTGKTPDKKYRGDGIFTEGEFYGMIFSERYDVVGVAGYFPKNNDLLLAPLSVTRREKIRDAIAEMTSGEGKEDYPTEVGPLCRYGTEEGEGCHYLSLCPDGQAWAAVADDPERFMEIKENGGNWGDFQRAFPEADPDSFGYWSYKLPILGY